MNNSSGFTLLEFLIAIVILMVGLLGMLEGINVAMSQNIETMLRNEAISVADEQMSSQRSKTFGDIASIPIPSTDGLKSRNIRGIFKNYSVKQTVTGLTFSNASTMSKRIDLTVSWKYKNKRNDHSISTVISK